MNLNEVQIKMVINEYILLKIIYPYLNKNESSENNLILMNINNNII